MCQISIFQDNRAIAPDLTITVSRQDISHGSFCYKYTLLSSSGSSANLFFEECQSPELSNSYEKLLSRKFESFNKDMRSPEGRQRLNRKLRTYGQDLYRSLFNLDFDRAYWNEIREKVRTIQIVSKEPISIPWELIVPINRLSPSQISEKAFFCELYSIAHWFRGDVPQGIIEVNRFDLVRAIKDDAAISEEVSIAGLLKENGRVFSTIEPSFETVSAAFSHGHRSILHLISHGTHNLEDADQCCLKLRDGDFTPDDVAESDRTTDHFFVFLNGCETGLVGRGLDGLGGWAYRLATRADTKVILGTILKIHSESARQFAVAFYTYLYSRRSDSLEDSSTERREVPQPSVRSILEAIKAARKLLRSDPVRLSYKVYGSPLVQVKHHNSSLYNVKNRNLGVKA